MRKLNAMLTPLVALVVGSGGMIATDTNNRGAFMLGGAGADALAGGLAADLLVGNAGDDEAQHIWRIAA
jgi:Ca2+-binding RTX toxin-like protein